MTRWDELRAFIDAHDPTYWNSTKGVPPDEIATCEEAIGIKLPRIYVDFLSSIGAECGELDPFGPYQACGFYRLVEDLPPESYPGQRYFKVAFEDDRAAVVRLDTFIDLERSDGDDAPLVMFEDIGELYDEDIRSQGFTLGEQFTRRVFDFFELGRHPKKSFLRIYPRGSEELEHHKQLLFQQLATMGLETVWLPLPRVACFHAEGLSALVEHRTQTSSLTVRFGAPNQKRLRLAVEGILDRFPGARADDDD